MFERTSKQDKLLKAKQIFLEAVDYDRSWQQEAHEDFLFRDGDQWSQKEKEILNKEMRPALTFNLTKSSVDLIMGMNEDNRVIFRCTPQEPNDDFLCEILNSISEWSREKWEFEDEEDAALESAAICGRGFVGVDFKPNPKRFGDIVLEETTIPVHEIHVDPSARRMDLSDASYITWDRWLSAEDFKVRYPKYPATKIDQLIETGKTFDLVGLSSGGQESAFEQDVPTDVDNSDYNKPMDMTYYDRARHLVRLIHMEYWETFKRYYFFDPESKTFQEFEYKDMKELKVLFKEKYKMDLEYEVLVDKRVNWIQFIGDEILYDGPSPLPYDGFSIVPMFAFRDVSQRTANHFGIVRLMKDPQREVNKRWSQALNLLNQSSQPGVFAEVDAFLNLDQALLSMKDPGSATLLNSGGLNKFKERAMPAFPSAPMQMEEYSQDVMRKITGINPDLLGQDRGRQEPGVVVRLRQQQGIILMKPLFKGYKRMRKQLFKRTLAVIMQYMSDEQMMRILGENGRFQMDPETKTIVDQQTGLTASIRDLRNVDYNIKVEEAPGNMTKRTLELTTFLEMAQTGFAVDPNVIINRLDLPATEKAHWMEYIAQQEQGQAEQQQKMMEAEMQFKDREITNEEKQTIMDFLVDIAKVNQQAQKDEVKAQTADKQMITNTILEMAKAEIAARNQQAAARQGGTNAHDGKK